MNALAMMASQPTGGVIVDIPEGVSFDGATDYLSRSSDLVGNVDSKTFTFSCWCYWTGATMYIYATTASKVQIAIQSTGNIILAFQNVGGANVLYADGFKAPLNTFFNILGSFDLTNTANRSIYVQDILQTVTWSFYTNDFIDFTSVEHRIGSGISGTAKWKGRLSHLFLDYTYRDLLIEANRRLFITADGKPADWNTTKALNGILMLQMKDAATAHINDGYGGNMVQNGTLDTASRGANQDNCVASKFDGVDDSMSSSSIGALDSKQITFSFIAKKSTDIMSAFRFQNTYPNDRFYVPVEPSFNLKAYNSAGTKVFEIIGSGLFNQDTEHHVVVSFDLSDINKRHIIFDGVDITSSITWSTYTNDSIGLTANNIHAIMYDGSTTEKNGTLGELYFDTKYIDLATNNPFWDSVENKPIPVRKAMANLGSNPLICSPLRADNPTANYGSGGAWTLNGGGLVGARGASEYWQRTAKYDGSTSYFSRAGLLSITDANKLTFVANVYKTASVLYHLVGTTNSSVSISINASNQLVITAKNAAGTTILSATVTTTIANTTWTEILVSIDLSNTANRSVYLNGVAASVTWTTYTNDSIDYTVASIIVGADIALANKFNGSMSLWFDNTYTDFTSEVNRNKYIDQLGYPKDLNSQVSSGIIAKPALFLNSDNVSALGANSGYGGDMTANGTIVSGADVLG